MRAALRVPTSLPLCIHQTRSMKVDICWICLRWDKVWYRNEWYSYGKTFKLLCEVLFWLEGTFVCPIRLRSENTISVHRFDSSVSGSRCSITLHSCQSFSLAISMSATYSSSLLRASVGERMPNTNLVRGASAVRVRSTIDRYVPASRCHSGPRTSASPYSTAPVAVRRISTHHHHHHRLLLHHPRPPVTAQCSPLLRCRSA